MQILTLFIFLLLDLRFFDSKDEEPRQKCIYNIPKRYKCHSSVNSNSSCLESNLGLPSPTKNNGLVQDTCFICNSKQKQKNERYEVPPKVVTFEAERTLKTYPKLKIPQFFTIYTEQDFIPKELQYHQSYYQIFTRPCKKLNNKNGQQIVNNYVLLAIDFQSVISYINHEVLELKQTVSMAIILSMYGLNVENIRYRSR